MDSANARDKREHAEKATDENAKRAEAMRDLSNADDSIGLLSTDVIEDNEHALSDLERQILDLGDECPPELRAAQHRAEEALAEVRQSLSDASKSIRSLSKHLKSL